LIWVFPKSVHHTIKYKHDSSLQQQREQHLVFHIYIYTQLFQTLFTSSRKLSVASPFFFFFLLLQLRLLLLDSCVILFIESQHRPNPFCTPSFRQLSIDRPLQHQIFCIYTVTTKLQERLKEEINSFQRLYIPIKGSYRFRPACHQHLSSSDLTFVLSDRL